MRNFAKTLMQHFSAQDVEDNRNDDLARHVASELAHLCSCGWSDEEHDWFDHSPLRPSTWTPADWSRGIDKAIELADPERLNMLWAHSFHTWHCAGWEVAAWPCPTVSDVLDELLGGDA